jgi:hypothetical protein
MTYICEFVGGPLNGQMLLRDAEKLTDKRSADLSEVRKAGGFVCREELDNKPEFDGYCGPMWDGTRGKDVAVLRYETWDVYNTMID